MFRQKIASGLIMGVIGMMSSSAWAGTILYEGSSTIGKFITDASKVYPASQFEINTVPESAGGEQCAMRRACDMGGVAREVGDEFIQKGVVKTLIAKDAIAVLVNETNPVKALTKEQLKDIFTGKITNWSQVGGEDLPIHPLVVKEASATREVFAKAILEGAEYQGVEVVTPDAKIASAVMLDKTAIGQLSFAFLSGKQGIRALVIDNQEPTTENSHYPISRPLYITTHGEPQGEVKAFLEWTLSPHGQQLIKQRFVGVK